jgi:hypothetical protein
VRIRIIGPFISVLISIFAIAIVMVVAQHSFSNLPQHTSSNPQVAAMSTIAKATRLPSATSSSETWEININIPTQIQNPNHTSTHVANEISPPSATPKPSATSTTLPTPEIVHSGYEEDCDVIIYEGIQHCTKGPYQIVRINPKNPYVRFETVLPMGYDRNGNYAECIDVQLPDSVMDGESTGPGCFIDHSYPAERVGQMARRYTGVIVAFNGDFFSSSYASGALGLTVKNGQRLDGNENDQEGREVRRSSLSISFNGEVRIGPIPRETLPNPEEPWSWTPDPDLFYNTIGGLPLLVRDGHPVDLHQQCMQEQGWCPDQYYPRARTAFGKTFDGHVFVVTVPEENGLTIEGLAHLMVELGAMEAINLDGGGSSQLWYAGTYLYYSHRPVAEGMLIFSRPITQMSGDSDAVD